MKHGNIIRYAGFLGLTALVLIFSGCFLSAPTGELVSPTIRAIGLPDISSVGTVTLKVTGPDMDPVEVSYTQLPSVINIAVPEGNDRKFELSVGLSSTFTANPAIPYTSYKGTATADITSDSAVVTLNMGIGSTKIIVPDAFNNRIVQIDDMNGAGWKTLSGDNISVSGLALGINFKPYDVDFDRYGNIYVANNESTNLKGGVYIFSSIEDTSPVVILPSTSGIRAVAVDRTNNRIYGVAGNGSISYVDTAALSVPKPAPFDTNGFEAITGIAVDTAGNVFLSGIDSTNYYFFIQKFGFDGSSKGSYSNTSIDSAGDVVVLNGKLYISAYDNKVYQMDPLTLASFTGSLTGYGSDVFKGSCNFVATVNDHLTLIDNFIGSPNVGRIISFNDISGSGWKAYGTYGTGTVTPGYFGFFGGNGNFYPALE